LIDESFIIDNDSKADWAIRKIAEAEREFERWKDFYAEQLRKASDELTGNRSFLIGKLEEYFQTVPTRATKTRSTYALPSGKLVNKFAKWAMECDAAALIAALSGTEYVVTEPKLRWGEYKKRLKIVEEKAIDAETGEVVPGVDVVLKPGRFDVELT
jgi:hypothetical protein